jgi:hypothetical protein
MHSPNTQSYAWITQNFNNVWTVRLLRVLTGFMMGALYIPIISTFSHSLACDTHADFTTLGVCTAIRPIIGPYSLSFARTCSECV